MIPVITNESAELVLDEVLRATAIQLDVVDTVYLADLLQDSGDGYRPFNPLIVGIGGAIVELPVTLEKGVHLITLFGDEFNAKALMLTGLQMFNIRDIAFVGPGGATGSPISEGANEELIGSIDGVNQAFTTNHPFVPGTTKLHMNTARMVLGVDYTEVGNQGLSLNPAPQVGDIIRIDYARL
jgi:hypothetical protein